MINFIFYILFVWGLTHILVASKIMDPMRNWLLINCPFFGDMLNCYQCTSFWVSIISYFMFDNIDLGGISFHIRNLKISIDFLLAPFISSGIISVFSIFISMIINRSKV